MLVVEKDHLYTSSTLKKKKKLWNYGHLGEMKSDRVIVEQQDRFPYFSTILTQVFLGVQPFLATAAAISVQSWGRRWWMVSGMKPDVQNYHNLFCSATIASSLWNHLVIQYSLLFITSCLYLPSHISQYYSKISNNERHAVIFISMILRIVQRRA